ncbi:MAG: PIG-L family deacetylase [Anaerolineales bacterium]|nr:PIG-L family deacetylase [Anaerolineales bacterium]
MPDRYAILGIFAHPDDEGSCSGCLAKYAAHGLPVYVACATRGDGIDAKISDPALATRETLAEVRTRELACTCAKLGAQPPIFLGYQDGEVDQVPVETAARAVADLIRELRPQVVITHGPEGGYGHPDHIAVSAFATRGFVLAADPAGAPGRPPFAPAKLYYTAQPRSFLEKVPGYRDRRADIRGQVLAFVGVPDELITTEVPIAEWMALKLEALSCHRTQFQFDPETGQPKLFATTVPEPQRSQIFGYERFVLAQSRLGRNGKETDLLAGL